MTSPAPAPSSSSLAFVPRRVKRTTAATRTTRLVPSLPISLDYPANVLLRIELRSQLPIKEDSSRSFQHLAEIKTRRITERIVSHCVDYVEVKEITQQSENDLTAVSSRLDQDCMASRPEELDLIPSPLDLVL